ncbi:hypothetical protein AB6A40_004135 [Gnathostoma spinigerum]|uniref:FHA domain-containing protein n=1 Tax=Gnathostoma spinigerum TaxID=75299 RepID=A0ABD6EJ45_9BILA
MAEDSPPSTSTEVLDKFLQPDLSQRYLMNDDSSAQKAPADARASTDVVMSIAAPTLEYVKPPWAAEPTEDMMYSFEVIKGGSLIDKIDFSLRKNTTFITVGRLPSCDIHLEHPSISRYHCILQYGGDRLDKKGLGWYLYDLGSTHGTRANKVRIRSHQYVRIRVGYVVQFGGSTRIMTLCGPKTDMDEELDCSPTELLKKKAAKEKLTKKSVEERKRMETSVEWEANSENDGISWGMEYDEEMAYAQARSDNEIEDQEARYRDDPLKTLSKFYDREGFDMKFDFTETGSGNMHKWICTIELPVDTAAGQSLFADATCTGSKKDAQVQCAFNACRMLDRHGLLFRSISETRRKAKDLAENDFYDSDEDIYLDRTGQIEKSRENRRRRAMVTTSFVFQLFYFAIECRLLQ